MFRDLIGKDQGRGDTPEELEGARERLNEGEGTIKDAFRVLPERLSEMREHNFRKYGLNPDFSEEEQLYFKSVHELMSEEQRKQFMSAISAYRKRGFPIRDRHDKFNGLEQFAATNPPETLRRHVWRLQRDLDEPLFGRESKPKSNRIEMYDATVFVSICDSCRADLEEETEASGLERSRWYKDKFNGWDSRDDRDSMAGIFLFKYEDKYAVREANRFLNKFPSGDPLRCHRCGIDEVELWRDRYGSREE